MRHQHLGILVAQCSATPASVAATPPAAQHLCRGSLTCDTPGSSRATGATGPFRGGCSATLLLHLKNPRILRKSAATRVARQGVPAHVCNYVRRSRNPCVFVLHELLKADPNLTKIQSLMRHQHIGIARSWVTRHIF